MALRILELAVEVRAMVGEENYRGKAVEVREKEVAVVENYRDKVVEVKVMVEACKRKEVGVRGEEVSVLHTVVGWGRWGWWLYTGRWWGGGSIQGGGGDGDGGGGEKVWGGGW
ncbi:UNVERIFIED_CONTAM: hypothetical protein Sangu_1549700 [Sesamum angustifolium]|uniref:Uncharacterized protein n=1 Tax=Sesamum angustifolium TaxID=2727405 RepID=A0AAW2MRY9_9LAMI